MSSQTPEQLLATEIGNDVQSLRSDLKNAKADSVRLIVEGATGVWSDDAPVRLPGGSSILFVGASDPADPINGINTPGNINPADVWLKRT